MTTAFVFHDDNVLMIKRSVNKKIHPGKWAGIGGHIEKHELNVPKEACLREIHEETGLKETDLSTLELRYIVFSKKKNEIWQQFVYIGYSMKQETGHTNEGELHWISKNEVMNLTMPVTHQSILGHYLNTQINETEILVGTNTIMSGKPQVIWNSLHSTT